MDRVPISNPILSQLCVYVAPDCTGNFQPLFYYYCVTFHCAFTFFSTNTTFGDHCDNAGDNRTSAQALVYKSLRTSYISSNCYVTGNFAILHRWAQKCGGNFRAVCLFLVPN